MNLRQTHFEIFLKRSPKADWALMEAMPEREPALEAARKLHETCPAGAVRVDKSTFHPDSGEFQTVSILSLGVIARAGPRETRKAEPPCGAPGDLATVHARRTIARVLGQWLDRQLATPLELLHSPALAERLEREDTMLQHAIQKTAIAQAAEHEADVQHFVKRLNELTEQAINDLLNKRKKNQLPVIGDDGFGALAGRLGEKRVFAMRAAVAGALASAPDWKAKIETLLRLADELDGCETRAAALTVLDDFLAEALAMPGGMESLAPEMECIGDRLEILVAVIASKENEAPTPAAAALARRFRAREMRGARGALIRHVLTELLRPQRLRPGAFWNEVHQVRRLADALIAMAGPDLPPEDISEAFVYRSGRLVQPEAVDEALDGAGTLHEEIERLIRLEAALAGTMAKKKLAAYLRTRLSSHRAETELACGQGNALERAGRIAALQQAVLDSRLPGEEKAELAAAFDRLCMISLTEGRVLDSLANGSGAPLDRAAMLLKLARRGGVTQGRASAEANARAQSLVRQAVRDGAAPPDKLSAIKSLLDSEAA